MKINEEMNLEYWDLDGNWDYDWQYLRGNNSLDLYQGMDKYGESVYILMDSRYDPDYTSAEYVTSSYHDAQDYLDADNRTVDLDESKSESVCKKDSITEDIGASEIYAKLRAVCKDDEIDSHASDLYVKVKPETTQIINDYEHANQVTTFIDNITHTKWYEIPFAAPILKEGAEGKKEKGFEYIIYIAESDKTAPIVGKRTTYIEAQNFANEYFKKKKVNCGIEKVPTDKFEVGDGFIGPFDKDYNPIKESVKDILENSFEVKSEEDAIKILKDKDIKFTDKKKSAGTNDIHYIRGEKKVAIYSPNRGRLYLVDEKLEESLNESSLVMDSHELLDGSEIKMGWDKNDGYYVEVIIPSNSGNGFYRAEKRRTFPTEERARNYYKRLVKQVDKGVKNEDYDGTPELTFELVYRHLADNFGDKETFDELKNLALYISKEVDCNYEDLREAMKNWLSDWIDGIAQSEIDRVAQEIIDDANNGITEAKTDYVKPIKPKKFKGYKKGELGTFQKFDSGNVEINNAFFNMSMGANNISGVGTADGGVGAVSGGMGEALEDSKSTDILETVKEKFGVVSEPYYGPTFILPDGSILDLSKENHHSAVEKFLIDSELSEEEFVETAGSPTLTNLGCIRCDMIKYYIQLSPELTREQLDALLVWLDALQNYSTTIEVYTPDGTESVIYRFDEDTTSDYVVDRIRRYYSSGKLYENQINQKHQFGFKYDRKNKDNKITSYKEAEDDFSDLIEDKTITESVMSELDLEVQEAGGAEKWVEQTEEEIKKLHNEIIFTNKQGQKEMNKGGFFDSKEDIEDSIAELGDRIHELENKLSIVKRSIWL